MIRITSTEAANRWASWLWDTGWQGGLLGSVALLVAALVGRRRPVLAYGIVIVALLKFLIPPLIPAPAALLRVMEIAPRTVIGETHEEQVAGLQSDSEKGLDPSAPPADASFGPLLNGAHTADAAAIDASETHGEPRRASDVENTAESPRWPWSSIAFFCYFLGLGVVSGWIVIGWLRVRRLVATAVSPDASLEELWQRIRQQLMPHRTVRLLVSNQRIAPLAFGVLSPVVLFTRELIEALDGNQRRTVLTHELLHHRRYDPSVIALELCAMALWWFHPVVWLLIYTSRGLRERCCDEATVRALGEPALQYAGVLETVARWLAEHRASFPPTSATMHPMGIRIHHLLDPLSETRPMRSKTVLWLLAIWSLLCLPTLRTSDAQSAPSAEAAAAEQVPQAPAVEQPHVFGSPAFTVTTTQNAGILVLNKGRQIAAVTSADCVILNSETGAVEHVLSSPAWNIKRYVIGADVTGDGHQLVVARAEPRDIRSVDRIEFLIFDARTFEQIRAVGIDVPRTVRNREEQYQKSFQIGSDLAEVFLRSENALLRFDISGPGTMFTYPRAVMSFDVASSSSRLATLGLDRAVTVWDIDNNTPVGEFPLETRWQNAVGGGIFFAPDEKALLIIDFMGADPTIWLGSDSGKELRRQPASGRASAATIADGQLWRALELLKEGGGYRVSAMDLADGSITHAFEIPHRAAAIAMDSAGDRVFGIVDRRVRIWNSSTGELLNPLPSNALRESRTVGITADGQHLLSNGDSANFVDVWQIDSGRHMSPTDGPTGGLAAVSLRGDYYLTASLFSGYTVRSVSRPEWHVSVGRTTKFDSMSLSPPVSFSDDGNQVRVLEPDGMLTVWNTASGEFVSELDLTEELGEPFTLRGRIKALDPFAGSGGSGGGATDYRGAGDISRWGRWLVYSDSKWARGYPLQSGAGDAWKIDLNEPWPSYAGQRWDVSNDGRRFVYRFTPETEPGDPLKRMMAMKSVPTGETLWERTSTWTSHFAISPDGRWVAFQDRPVADATEELVVADVETGRELARRPAESGITALAWSPDSQLLTTAHYDTTAIVWPIGDLLKQ